MRQRIVIAKIAGRAGATVIEGFRAWSKQRAAHNLARFAPDQWDLRCREEIDVFADCLRLRAHVPPVVFFCEYVDMWSMGDVFTRCFAAAKHPLIQVCSDRFELACYPLPDDGALAGRLRQKVQDESLIEQSPHEERWLALNLLEAIAAWEPLVSDGALVIIREVLGDTATDSQVTDSLARVPSWIPRQGENP